MAFVTLLATAVGILSALGLLIVGLVEAPWQLMLVGLLGALYGLQRQIWASEATGLPPAESKLDPAAEPAVLRAGAPRPVTSKPSSLTAAAQNNGSKEEGEATEDCYELTYRGIPYRLRKSTSEALSDSPKQTQNDGYRG